MAEKKPSVEELAQRIEQLLVVLREISEDLADISKHLKAAGAPTLVPSPTAPSPSAVGGQMRSIADVRKVFPKDLEDMLVFEDKGEFIEIKPRRYLGSENFAKIASLVRSAGGEYKSAGKESHFRIPK